MARRDVDLVVRAKDEAAKVLDQITTALEQFSDAAKGVDSSAGKTESSLGQLGAAVSQLKKNIGTLDVGEKLTRELAKAEAQLTKMEKKAEETSAEMDQLSRKVDQAGERSARYANKVDGATRALDRQKSKLTTAKREQQELTKAQTDSERAQAKLAARQAKLPALLDAQAQKAQKAKQRYADLSDQIRGTVAPSRTLQEQFEASARNVDRQQNKLVSLADEYQRINGQLRAAGSAITIFGEKADQATRNVAKQETVLGKIEQNLRTLKVQSNSAAGAQTKLSKSLSDITTSLARQEQQIEKAEGSYVELALAAGQADRALDRLTGGALEKLEAELLAQRKAALEAKRSYAEYGAEATRLAGIINRAKNPLRETVEGFERAKTAARLAKQEYLAQRQAVELMGRAYRGTGTDIESINGTQQRFVTILRNTTSALDQQRAAAARNQAEISRISGQANRASTAQNRLGTVTQSTAAATERAAASTSRLAAAYRQFYGDSRRSLSLLQRIRGEVLSLAASYAGLFAGIEVLRGTVDAYQTLEAVQSRLNVANSGDQVAAANDLDFLRRNADRLGISLGVLATEYSKFAIATQNTNLEGSATRKIFLSVAESARVNRSSTQEMSGVFTALTQIVSKGTVQMEELKQQLGDRLPGALKIMADGLGVSTAELTKMLEQGQVTSDALLPFADELSKRFGPGLAEALRSTSTQLGRLGNAAFEALVKFGEAGFIESFGDFADRLTNLLQSADFEAFTSNVSAAFGQLFDLFGFAADNFQLVVAAITAFIGLKLTPVVLAMVGSLRVLNITSTRTTASFTALQTRAAAMGVTITRTGFAIRQLRVAMLALLSTTGIGVLVAAVGAGVALWASEADSATEAMTEHRRILNEVKNAYDQVGRSVEEWRESVENLSVTEAKRNLRNLKEALQESAEAFDRANQLDGASFGTTFFGRNISAGATQEYNDAIRELIERVQSGEVALTDLATEVDAINQQYDDGSAANRRYGEALFDAAKAVSEQADAVEEAKAILQAKIGTDEEAKEALEDLVGTVKESAAETESAAEKSEKFAAAIREISQEIPQVKKELDYLEDSKALDNMLQKAIQYAQSWEEVAQAMRLAGAAQTELDRNFRARSAGQFEADFVARAASGAGSNDEELVRAVTALAKEMGLAAEDLLTVISFETGGSLDPGQLGPVTQWGQHFGLIQFGQPQGRRYGVTPESSVTEQVIAAGRYLEDAGVQAGDSLLRIYAAINAGDPDKIYASDANNGGTPGTVLDKVNDQMDQHRARAQGLLAAYGGTVVEAEKLADEQQRSAEAAEKARQATQESIANGQFQIDQQELVNAGKEREAAIQAAIREARSENADITDAEIAAISEQTGRLFDLKAAHKEVTTEKEKAQKAEEAVNNLLAQRQALEQQLQIATENGETDQAENLRLKIGEINAELLAAIENAQAMWRAVGGDAAQAAIEKLEVAKLETRNFGEEAGRTYLQWDRVSDLFVTGLANAFDVFAQKVAEGESVGEAARAAFLQFAADFLREIAMMIVQQAIFNALRGAFGGTPFGGLIGVGAAHSGGIIGSKRAGSGNQTRHVSPAAFASARRYHEGGIVGLAPGEVPIIAQQGEEMLTKDDPRHMLNGGKGGGKGSGKDGMTIINTIDPAAALEQALAAGRGKEILLNAMRGNRTEIKAALG